MGLSFSVLVREDLCGEGGFTRLLSQEKPGSLLTAPLHWVCRVHWKVVFCDGAGGAKLSISYLTRAFYLSSCSA